MGVMLQSCCAWGRW